MYAVQAAIVAAKYETGRRLRDTRAGFSRPERGQRQTRRVFMPGKEMERGGDGADNANNASFHGGA